MKWSNNILNILLIYTLISVDLSNCQDGNQSDQDNLDNYLSKVHYQRFKKPFNKTVLRVKTTCSIVSIREVDKKDFTFKVKFGLSYAWQDPRLKDFVANDNIARELFYFTCILLYQIVKGFYCFTIQIYLCVVKNTSKGIISSVQRK